MMGDQKTAKAFAKSWNDLKRGSVYTQGQFRDWFEPLTRADFAEKSVLEMGCGNGSLMLHLLEWKPRFLVGLDLGDSVESARINLEDTHYQNWRVVQEDLTSFRSEGFDVVYSIGVIHHLEDPKRGFEAVLKNVRAGGRFHCWVYGKEGNALIIRLVEPLRKVVSRMPWRIGKYCCALPLAIVLFLFTKGMFSLAPYRLRKMIPLGEYLEWIRKRNLQFFWHVVFDQLVAPSTIYIERKTLESWMKDHPKIDPLSVYIVKRNGNSWKFGGVVH